MFVENPDSARVDRKGQFRFRISGDRDYLGAEMGLGIRREAVGDILVTDNGCAMAVIRSVAGYIKENLTEDLSLKKLSQFAGFSPIHFHNCFKASTGITLHEYVEEQRIKKAANMLITTDYTLAEIAYECGFSSHSYFSYAFKRKMNKTPREYAKEVFERYGES